MDPGFHRFVGHEYGAEMEEETVREGTGTPGWCTPEESTSLDVTPSQATTNTVEADPDSDYVVCTFTCVFA